MNKGLRHRQVAHTSRISPNGTGIITTENIRNKIHQYDVSEHDSTQACVSGSGPPSSNNSYELLLSWRRILLLIMAVTVHNFPEGLAVGVGFGSIGKTPAATFEKAFNLALGIGLQNFPEGK